ncbi:hypothetical protein E2C01_089875 [Portunus trituberculatus]|uniref:Uncharacterized protein n=1 Tax=Portunus trituberculatus TaxID=210409 RepID=A0A5B7JKA5_PORTR|nr:hypothetical protein [Portunus trituberculatus]
MQPAAAITVNRATPLLQTQPDVPLLPAPVSWVSGEPLALLPRPPIPRGASAEHTQGGQLKRGVWNNAGLRVLFIKFIQLAMLRRRREHSRSSQQLGPRLLMPS